MEKRWRYLWAFIRHCYTFLFLFLVDPFDILEKVFHVNYSLPIWLSWFLLSMALIFAVLLTFLDLRKLAKNNPVAWLVYDNLCELFRKLAHSTDEKERDKIHADIEKERGKLPDRGLDKLIRLFLDAESERQRYGIESYSDNVQYILSLQNERMRNHILNKYGDRIWTQSTVNIANPNT